jgi:sterol 3beta-glucosyltransferase
MKLIVATYGTEGDARPFPALCRGLIDAGQEARLLADAATLGSARALCVPTTALAGDIRGALAADHDVGGGVAKGGGFTVTTRALATIANANAKSWLGTIIEVGEAATRGWRRGWPHLPAFSPPKSWAPRPPAPA